jgi:amino acid transporter
MDAIARVSTRLGCSWLVPLAALLVAFTCLGGLGAWLGSVARIPFVAGLDSFLPKAFGRLHARYGSPANALITQAVIAGLFAVLGQAGTSVKVAYDVLISMMVIALMLPFLLLFAAAIRLSGRPSAPGELRIPGGRFTIVATALVGFATTLGSIVLAVLPQPGDAEWVWSLVKIVGGSIFMVGAGAVVYALGSSSSLATVGCR